ncbi:hypothetical protein JVT61DRAFT_11230 [Boletus reticuloceps]|uniref:Uncharacterized protein n=1 Tax=Boletus reticuloceps TaxID=495285 RepID=A0A8I3A4R3_9AGAM|nr:hypothetical protein JVT61DRAFT_11230 [Boletus reticuloceps]
MVTILQNRHHARLHPYGIRIRVQIHHGLSTRLEIWTRNPACPDRLTHASQSTFSDPYPLPGYPGIPNWRPRSNAPWRRQPLDVSGDADQGAPQGLQSAPKIAWSHSRRAYLTQARLPKYVLGPQADPSVRYEWPFFRALAQVPRTLYSVQRMFEWDLRRALLLGDKRLTSALAKEGKLADLTLPDTLSYVLDEHDVQFFDRCCLNAPSDVTKAYPLRTIIKIMKLFLDIHDDHRLSALLKFDDVNHLSPIRNAGCFDLIALPRSQEGDLTLLVAPCDVMHNDFEEFACPGAPDEDLDLLTDTGSPYKILQTVM